MIKTLLKFGRWWWWKIMSSAINIFFLCFMNISIWMHEKIFHTAPKEHTRRTGWGSHPWNERKGKNAQLEILMNSFEELFGRVLSQSILNFFLREKKKFSLTLQCEEGWFYANNQKGQRSRKITRAQMQASINYRKWMENIH